MHMYNGTLLSHKKNDILPFAATRMDLEGIRLSEINQRKTNTVRYNFYVEFKEKEAESHIEKKLVVTSGKREGGRGNLEVGE